MTDDVSFTSHVGEISLKEHQPLADWRNVVNYLLDHIFDLAVNGKSSEQINELFIIKLVTEELVAMDWAIAVGQELRPIYCKGQKIVYQKNLVNSDYWLLESHFIDVDSVVPVDYQAPDEVVKDVNLLPEKISGEGV